MLEFSLDYQPDGDPSMSFDLKEANQLSNSILVFKG